MKPTELNVLIQLNQGYVIAQRQSVMVLLVHGDGLDAKDLLFFVVGSLVKLSHHSSHAAEKLPPQRIEKGILSASRK